MYRIFLPLLGLVLAAPGMASAQAPAANPCLDRPERCITVSFRDSDIRDVIAGFARFSGHSVVIGSGVAGRVNAEIRNQPWDVALRAILRANGYDAVITPTGILRIESLAAQRATEELAPLVTRVFRLNYVPATEMVATFAALRSERGSITVSPTTNSLIVTDTEAHVARIAALLGR
jgi:type IV pilus assembly protein PilQ